VAEILALFAGIDHPSGNRLLRESWRGGRADSSELDRACRPTCGAASLSRAGFPHLLSRPRAASSADALERAIDRAAISAAISADRTLELSFEASHAVYDGRFAGVPWLQELPRPITKLTWDNAAALGPATAARLGLATGDVARLELGARSLDARSWSCRPREEAVSLELGHGRRAGGAGHGVGCDANRLRLHASLRAVAGLRVRATGRRHQLAITQKRRARWGARSRSPRRSPATAPGPTSPRSIAVRSPPSCRGRTNRPAVGDDDRHHDLHGLQRLRGRLPVGEQRPRGRARGSSEVREMHWLRIRTPTGPGRTRRPTTGTLFSDWQATTQALQPVQIMVSIVIAHCGPVRSTGGRRVGCGPRCSAVKSGRAR